MEGVKVLGGANSAQAEKWNNVKAKEKPVVSGVLFWLLVAMYAVAYNQDWRAITPLWYGISALTIMVLVGIVFVGKKSQVKLSFFVGWAVAFFAFCLLACLWALDMDASFDVMKTLLLVFVSHVLISSVLQSKEDVNGILMANLIALLVMALYILFTVDLSQLGEDRLGGATHGEYWNANDLGLKLCVGVGLALYFAFKYQKLWQRILFLAIAVLFGYLALYTGSRKVLLMLMLTLLLLFWLKAKRHKIRSLLVAIACAAGVYVLVMNVEPLYNVLGVRVEEMINGLFGEGTTEGSFNTRQEMIEMGWNWFLERPLLGYGLANFSVLYGEATNFTTYAHNNFIEILVSGGIVGFVLYYSIYVYLLVKLFKPAFQERDLLSIILFSSNIILLVLQVALVSYYDTMCNCLLMIGVSYVNIRKKVQ